MTNDSQEEKPMKKLLCLLLLLGLGCQKEQEPKVDILGNLEEDKVIMVPEEDPAMLAAIKKAGETVQADFIPHLTSPGPKMDGFAIKYPVSDGTNEEHMWLNQLSYADGKFTGVIDNRPNNVKGIEFGQKMTIAADAISDWMFIDDGQLRGGFTMRVMRDKLPPEERAKFDAAMPFKID